MNGVISRYKAALGAKPCKYFEAGKSTSRGPFCPFGDEGQSGGCDNGCCNCDSGPTTLAVQGIHGASDR